MADWQEPVDIGDLTVSRAYSMPNACDHRSIELITNGEIVRCNSCGATLSAFWALQQAHMQWKVAHARLDARKTEIEESYRQRLTFIAAKRIEQAWRRRGTFPACPHCHRGITTDDRLGSIRKDDELEHRKSDAARADQERQWRREKADA